MLTPISERMKKMAKTIVPYTLDDYFASTPIGSVDRASGNNLFGINHQQTPGAVPANKDTFGLTFFTRPQLNLQSDNLRNERRFYSLLTNQPLSMQRYIRCMLDPRAQLGHQPKSSNNVEALYPPIPCPLVDSSQAFIPVLTNNLLTLSGWPDVVAPVFESESGMYKESYAQVDGLSRNYESFDLDASFRNTRGDPILYMFYIWLQYMSDVFEGKLVPYMDYLVENVIDYNTRIYRLVLDVNKQKVKKIAATGASFPVSVPTGSFFDFNSETPYSDQNKDITIRFRCMGADYLDDILIKEFNDTVKIFNPSMFNRYRDQEMVRVSQKTLPLFNNRGYPRIDETTYDLEWWVSKDMYASVITGTHPDLLSFYPSASVGSDTERNGDIDVPLDTADQTYQDIEKASDTNSPAVQAAKDASTQAAKDEYDNTGE
jgi:hypothetical protein